MNDEASHDPDEPAEDALDVNLRELLRRAPEPARLDADGRARLADALREASGERADEVPGAPHQRRGARAGRRTDQRPGRSPAPRPARILRRRALLAAAAVLVIAALGALLLDPFDRAGGDGRGGDGQGVIARDDGAVLPPPAGGQGSSDAGPERAPANVDGGAAEQLAAADELDASDLANDVVGTLWFDSGAAPTDLTEVEVWSRPVLSLPRVADSERALVPVAGSAPTQDAALPFLLEGERARARALGAERIAVTCIAPGFGQATGFVDVSADGDTLSLRIDPGATVRGTVTDARTGTPIAGALVLPLTGLPLDSLDVAERPSDALPRPWAETDASGRFEVVGVDLGPVRMRASAPGFAPSSAEPSNLAAVERALAAGEPVPPLEVDVELRPGGSVEGVVEREDGTRHAGALVIASLNDMGVAAGPRGPLTYGGAMADELGRYRIDDLPDGPHVVLVFGADGGRGGAPKAFRFARVERGQATRVDFLSTASSTGGGSIVGTLRGPGGDPVAGAALTIGPSDGSQDDWAATTTDDEGGFRFDDLAPETYTLLAAEDDFRTLSLVWSGRVDGPETLDVSLTDRSIRLLPSAYDSDLQGRVVLEDGWAMLERSTESGEWEFAGSTELRASGGRISGVPAGRYRATYIPAANRALGVAFGDPFEPTDADGLSVELEVPAGRALEVVVVDESGAPVSGAVVEVVELASGRTVLSQEPILTDGEGRARIAAVPLGHARVDVRTRRADGLRASVETRIQDAAEGPAPLRVVLD